MTVSIRNGDRRLSLLSMAQLRAWLARTYGEGEAWRLELAVSIGKRGRKRFVYRLCSNRHDDIALKAHRDPIRNAREFRALHRLADADAPSLRPYFLAWDMSFYAMDWVAAPTLRDVLGGSDRHLWLERAGAWLAKLHHTSSHKRLVEARLLPLHLNRKALDKTDAEATAKMKSRLASVDLKQGPRSIIHGDLHAKNLFALPDQIVGYDRETDGFGLTFLDVAALLADVSKSRFDAIRFYAPWDGNETEDREAFFRGYGPIEAPHLQLFDTIEDALVFRKWRQQVRAGEADITDRVLERGLVGDGNALPHPGRLVRRVDGSVSWDTARAFA
ncbi:MAG: phosphotransferase [Pseudomonadota bacterium]